MKLIAFIAFSVGLVSAKFNNASLEYASKLTCESCIRGGYEYCDFYSDAGSGKIQKNSSSECFLFPKANDTTITQPGVWNETGYFCSRWFLNKMNAIVNQCQPKTTRKADCGDYLVNLAEGGKSK